MAAFDSYSAFLANLPTRDLDTTRDLQALAWSDLVAARSEEARLRVVENFVREVNERVAKSRG